MNLKRLIRLADAKRVRDGFWNPYKSSLYKKDYYMRQHNSGVRSESGKEFGVDFDTTLEWVRKKNPNMSADEQEKFAWNIINKKKREREELEKNVEKNKSEVRPVSRDAEGMGEMMGVPSNYTGD